MNNKALETYNDTKEEVVHISKAVENDGNYSQPFPMGIEAFDKALMGGVREGDLVIVTGLSGHGKTSLVQNISVNLSEGAFPSVWFSYEVMIDNLYAKFKTMTPEPKDLLLYTPKRTTTGKLDWIKKKIEEAIKKFDTKFVFIDHIDFLTPSKLETSDQRRIMLRDICSELKTMAIEKNVIIFLVAHVKKVQNRQIEMQDIAESSGIYQLADCVMSVTRLNRVENVDKIKIEVATDKSIARILKNRITGEQPFIKFALIHNKIQIL